MRSHRIPYVVCLVVSLPLTVLWSLATPVMAVVDDPAHIAAAAGAVRGEFHQPTIVTVNGRQQALRIPGKLATLTHVADCLIQSSDTLPTQCGRTPVVRQSSVIEPSTAIRYPPVFYWATGWPTLIFSGLTAYWGVTVMAAIVNAALLALGLWGILNFGRRALVLAWLVCLTPEVLYLAGSANDSGFEIAAAIAAWSCVSALVTWQRPPRELVIAATIATASFMLARPVSPVWVLIMLAALAIVAGRARLRAYLAQRPMQVAAGVIIASGFGAALWRLYVGSPNLLYVRPPQPTSLNNAFRIAAFSLRGTLQSEIGIWLNTLAPLGSLLLWIAAFGLLLTAGVALAPRRSLVVTAGLVTCVFAVPVLANVIDFNKIGLWWQGRDGIPFGVGLPIVLGLAVPNALLRNRSIRRLIAVGVASVGALSVVAFLWILHRYTTGVDGSWRPSAAAWQPPGGFVLLSLFFTFAWAGLCFVAWRWMVMPIRSRRVLGVRPVQVQDDDLLSSPVTEPNPVRE